MTARSVLEKCVFLTSAVCTDHLLWSIMQVWRYIMLLVIATPQISLYCFYLMLLLFTFVLFTFPLLFPTVLLISLFPSLLFLPLPLPLFSSTASCLHTPSSQALCIVLSSPLAFLHNVFLPNSPVTMYICCTHFPYELVWHLFIFLLPQPLTLIISVCC